MIGRARPPRRRRQDQAVLRQLGQQPELVRQARAPAAPQRTCSRSTTRTSSKRSCRSSATAASRRTSRSPRPARRSARTTRRTPAEAPAAVPPLPGALGRLRPPPLHGRRLRRQLLLQQPRRLRREPLGPLVPRAARAGRHPARDGQRAPTRTRGRAISSPGSCGRGGSGIPSTTGGPTAGMTGPTGSARSTSTSETAGCTRGQVLNRAQAGASTVQDLTPSVCPFAGREGRLTESSGPGTRGAVERERLRDRLMSWRRM